MRRARSEERAVQTVIRLLAVVVTIAAVVSAVRLVLDGFWYRNWFWLAGGAAAAVVGFVSVQFIGFTQ